MAFRFSLATVLMVRKSIEKREELALRKVQYDIAQIRQRIESLASDIHNKQNECNIALQQPTRARDLHAMLAELNSGVEARKKLCESLTLLEKEQEKRMKTYQAAHSDFEMLAGMFTEQRAIYDREQARNEQKMLDEIFCSRASRG
jgi:flagellar export protein FliJ